MAIVVENKVKVCRCCGCKTLHHRNTKKMSTGESIGHLALVIFTAGLWLIPLILQNIWMGMTSPIAGGWVCSKCGSK